MILNLLAIFNRIFKAYNKNYVWKNAWVIISEHSFEISTYIFSELIVGTIMEFLLINYIFCKVRGWRTFPKESSQAQACWVLHSICLELSRSQWPSVIFSMESHICMLWFSVLIQDLTITRFRLTYLLFLHVTLPYKAKRFVEVQQRSVWGIKFHYFVMEILGPYSSWVISKQWNGGTSTIICCRLCIIGIFLRSFISLKNTLAIIFCTPLILDICVLWTCAASISQNKLEITDVKAEKKIEENFAIRLLGLRCKYFISA